MPTVVRQINKKNALACGNAALSSQIAHTAETSAAYGLTRQAQTAKCRA